MAIDFNKLPDTNPFALPDPGYYKFTITKAEMKQPTTDAAKPPYLNLTYALVDKAGKKCGNLFDMLSESTTPIVQYKIGRFVKALGLNLTNSMELKDLAKLVVGRGGVVEVEHKKDKDKQGNDVVRAQVKMFGTECFWPASEFNTLVNGAAGVDAPAGEVPFDFSDEDAPVPQVPGSTEY